MNVNQARAMQVSWIDAAQLSALADTLRPRPTAKQEHAETDSCGEVTFSPASESIQIESETCASEAAGIQADGEHQPLDEIRSKLKAIRERALQAGLIRTSQETAALPPADTMDESSLAADSEEEQPIEEHEATESLPPLPSVSGDVNQRISLFADWARPALKGNDLFIVDDEGQLLWGPPLRSSIVLSAIMAHMAAARMSALTACETDAPSYQTLASGSHLTLLPCATRLGIMHIAILGAAILDQAHLPQLSQTLIQTMDL